MAIDVAFDACEGKGSGEQGLLRHLLDSSLNKGEMLLGDAYFLSYFLLWTLQMMGVDCLCEQIGGRARSADFRRGKSLGVRDHLITYDKSKVKPDWAQPGRPRCSAGDVECARVSMQIGQGKQRQDTDDHDVLRKALQERRTEDAVQPTLTDRNQFSSHQDKHWEWMC